jgi:hypothetical protein
MKGDLGPGRSLWFVYDTAKAHLLQLTNSKYNLSLVLRRVVSYITN